jgi:transposase
MRAYSMDLRERVLADSDLGMGPKAVAAKYRVSESWVRRLKQRRKATGETTPRPSGRRPTTWRPHAERIREAVRDAPDLTLQELKARLELTVSLATLWRAVKALGLTLKKKSSGPRSETDPTLRRSGSRGKKGSPGSTRRG